jgi:putative oxidoreductase
MPLELPETVAFVLVAIGRVLLGGLFVLGGMSHFPELDPISEGMRARGVPFARTTLLAGTIWQIVFGVLLMLGLFTTIAALALALFLVLATIMMLNFWDLAPGPQRDGAYRTFKANAALLGGLLIAAAA